MNRVLTCKKDTDKKNVFFKNRTVRCYKHRDEFYAWKISLVLELEESGKKQTLKSTFEPW